MDDPRFVRSSDHPPRIDLLGISGKVRPMVDIEADAIRLALAHCGHNVAKAARLLRISRSTLYRKAADGLIILTQPDADQSSSSPRQAELLALLAEPKSAATIARTLNISRQAANDLLGKLMRDGKAVRLPSSPKNGWLYVRAGMPRNGEPAHPAPLQTCSSRP